MVKAYILLAVGTLFEDLSKDKPDLVTEDVWSASLDPSIPSCCCTCWLMLFTIM